MKKSSGGQLIAVKAATPALDGPFVINNVILEGYIKIQQRKNEW